MSNTLRISDPERKQLGQFVRLVLDMSQSRFIQRAKTQDHGIHGERIDDGSFKITIPNYDWEDFRSFLTIFRQLALSKEEAAYLPKIKNIVARYADNDLRQELDKLRADIFPILEGKYMGIKFGAQLKGKEEISLTSFELLDAIVNGLVFHGDQDRENETQLILTSRPGEYIWIILIEVIVPVFNACVWLMNIIRSKKYLEEKDF